MVKTIVAKNLDKTPEEWQRHVLTWAKESGSGEYRPGYWEGYELTCDYNDYLRSIGRWPRPGRRLALLTPTTQIREVAPLPLEEGLLRHLTSSPIEVVHFAYYSYPHYFYSLAY